MGGRPEGEGRQIADVQVPKCEIEEVYELAKLGTFKNFIIKYKKADYFRVIEISSVKTERIALEPGTHTK